MSKTPVVTSGEVNVKVEFHLSKVPFIDTDASTSKEIELTSGVIAKTGTPCARLIEGRSKMDANRERVANRMAASVNSRPLLVNYGLLNFGYIFGRAHIKERQPLSG